MAVNGRFLSGSDLDIFRETARQSAASGGLRAEIESGTEAPKVLMPNSPLKALEDAIAQTVKSATDMQKKKEDQAEEKHPVDSLQIRKDRAQKALDDFDNNKEIDWTDTNQRKAYDAERKRLQEEVDRAGAEIDARADATTHEANMAEIAAMDDEDLGHLEQYIESRDARRSVFGNPISWFQNYNTETDNKNVLLEKYGEDRLAELAEIYGRQLHEEQAKKIEEDTKTSVDQNWISAAIHNIVGIPARAMGGVEALAGRMYEKIDRTGQYRTLEEYTPGDMLSLYGNTVSGTTAQNIAGEDGNVGRQILSIGYQGVMSLADSIARAFFGGGSAGGAALAATGSFSQAVSEATKQGASPQQAVTLGVATAGMEYISEKIPMDEVFKLAKAGNTKVLAQAFKQAGVEITTEELNLFGSMAAEAAILQEKSSYRQQIGDLVANGTSYEDAKAQADKAVWEEVKQTALVSGFAGTLSGGGAAIVGNLATNNAPAVTEEAQQEQPVQTPPAAPVVEPMQQTGPSTEQLLEGIRDMTPAPEPLTEELQHFDNAAAIANGVQPAQQSAADTTLAAETPAEESTVINTDPAQHTPEEQATIDAYQNSIDDNLVAYIEAVRNNPGQKMPRYPLKNVDTRAADDIKRLTGIDTTGNKTQIEARAVEHILKRHGEHGNGDHSMRDVNDIARIQYVIDNYDSMEHGGKTSAYVYQNEKGRNVHAQTVVIKKKVNGTYFVVEAVPDTKKKTLFVVSAYMSQNGQKETAPSLSGDAEAYRVTSDNATKSDAVSNNSIPENVAQVNGNYSFEHLGRANAAIAEFRQSDEYKAMSHDQRVQAINEIIDYFVRVVDENEPGVAVVSDRDQKSTQPNVDLTTAQEETVYHDEFEDWGKDPNREGVANPLSDRSYSEVGKRSVKAYMYENPAVKPFYQEQAAWLLSELADSTKGERTYNEQLHYESGGEQGWSGSKRHTSDSIAELLDQDGMTYEQIEKGLNAIIHDNGQENNAISKRIEFVINDRLMNGYTDFYTGQKVPGNAEYLNLLRNQQSVPTADMQMGATNQSAAGGQIKGTGAAERNFSGKEEYNNLLYDGNVQKDRPTDARSMEVPKRDSDGRRVTEFAANAYAAEVTPDHMASEIESLIQDKELSFDTRSNQESLHNAAEAIEETGEEETRLRISRNASENRIQDGDIEQGLLLYAKYAADPEMQDQASSLLVDMGKLANMSGRNLQMFSLLRRMTPEGRVMTVQKNVARYVQDINKGRSARQQIDSARIIDKDLEQQLRTATTDEKRQEIENEIYKDVASQIKPTLGEAWDAWRNLAMLGNPKTHERNFISTGTWKPFAVVKRDISAVLQKVFLKQEQRTASILGISKKDIDLLAWAKVDAKDQDIQERMGFSGTTGNEARNAIEENRQMLPGFLDKLAKGNRTLMEKEDMIWKRSEYAPALAGFMKARGYTADQIHNGEVPNGILEDARQYAIKEAQKATFNDSNEFSDWVTSTFKPKRGRAVDPILNILKKGSVPFLRTPANVVVRAMEYNPIALGKTLLTAKRDIDSGKKSAADVVNDISAGLAGTAAMGIGAMLAAGMVPGVKLHGKVDDEDALREGIKSYSLQIGNKCYSMAWLAPGMIPLFTGANVYNMWTAQADEANADVDGWDLVESLKDVAVDAIDPILELSMLSNLNDIIDNVAYEEDDGDKLMAFFLNAVTSYMFQGLPTIFGQIEQSTEETKSSTYINTDNKTEATVKRTLSSASQRIPGLDLYQTVKLNEWGELVKNEGSSLERAMAAMFSPSSVTEVKDDAITEEITRLNRAQSENVSPPSFSKIVSYTDIHGNIHANVRLTEEQYQTMARTQGQTSKRLIAEMLLSEDYKVMTDEQKAKAITQVYSYARKTAEKATFQDHEGYSANWMNDAAEGEPKDTAAYIMRRITNSDINSAMTSLDSAWDKNHDQAIVDRWMRELDTAYNAYSNMSKDMKSDVREFATGTTAKYLEARDNGVSHEDFLTVAEGINSVKGTGKYNAETGKNAVREIDRRGVIANANISTAAKDKLMMAYMEDYEHGVEGTETSELKYQYIRQELGLSPQDYIKAYEVDLAGGKWRNIRSGIMKALGCDYGTANKLLLIFEGRYKQQLIDWYTS